MELSVLHYIRIIIFIGEYESPSSSLSCTVQSCIDHTPFNAVTKLRKAGKDNTEVTSTLFGRRFEESVNVLQQAERRLFGDKRISYLPPEDTFFALNALRGSQRMCYAVILTGESAHKERMVRDIFLFNCAYILARVKLPVDIGTVTKMLNIAIMRPLDFLAGLPLREPNSLSIGRKPIKPESETSDSGKQLTNRFIHF